MKTMKTVESRVLQILRDCPETRNEDMLLFYRYYNRFATIFAQANFRLKIWHITTRHTDFRALSLSAEQGSVCSPCFLSFPATVSTNRMVLL